MLTKTGLPRGASARSAPRHPPLVRAPHRFVQRGSFPRGSLRGLALSAFTAWVLGALTWGLPGTARATEARPQAASRPAASAPARPQAARPAANTAARPSANQGARRPAHTRTAQRARPPAGTTRMRDAPQELIPVLAADMPTGTAQLSPRAACLQATQRAEQVHGLPTGLLTAVALAESGLHAYALSIGGRAHFPPTEEAARQLVNSAPPRRSIMAGCVQVNARVHARNSHWPLNPDASADWAGGMMARWARETGSWSTALRRWHGGSPASTQRLVCRVKAKMEVTSPGSDIFEDWNCASGLADRTRRNGEIHLATAQRQTQ